MRALVLISLLLLASNAQAEDSYADSMAVRGERYDVLIAAAEEHYEAEEYAASVQDYVAAFDLFRGPAPSDLYNAACSAALDGQVGRAFGFLHRAIDWGWENLSLMRRDTDLDALREHESLWAELQPTMDRAMRKRYGDGFNSELAAELVDINDLDQGIRNEWHELYEQYGNDLPDSIGGPFTKRWTEIDKNNMARLAEIIEEFGWPKFSLVGRRGAKTAFLVVQHAELEEQERYFPMLEAAVAEGEANAQDLALLTDRIRMYNGEPQLYGSQIHWNDELDGWAFYPIENPERVNARRAEVGLGPIESYAKSMDVEFNVEQIDE